MKTPYVEEPGALAESFDWWDLQYTKLDDQLICPICRTAFVDPYSTDCGHTFCHKCLQASWESSCLKGVCPIDRSTLKTEPHLAPFLIRSLVDELEVSCPYADRGCAFVDKRWLLEAHVKNDCGYVKVFCHYPCENHVERRQFDAEGCSCESASSAHSGDDASDATQPSETNKIAKLTLSDSDSASIELTVKCLGNLLGCNEIADSCDTMKVHEDQCPLAKVAIALEQNTKRLNSLEYENRTLKRQLDVFQHMIKSNATELDSQILSEYERILCELRDTKSELSGQQSTVASLAIDYTRLSTDVSYIKGSMDSIRRQLFLLNQSQRRLSLYSTLQLAHHAGSDTSDSQGEEPNRKRGQQKL